MKLSTKWRIEKIRTTAIDNLRTISFDDPIFAIILARDYNVDQWLQPAFHKLAKRQKSLSPPEIRALGDEYVAKICKIRDRAIDLIALRGDVYDWGNNLLITPKRYNVDFTSVIEYELKH